jgi:REP element-mobilizing transposase RayT
MPNFRAPPKNIELLALIRAKRERHWRPSAEDLKRGFRGWHQRGFLPHFDAPGVTQFVTFQLADSFPVERRVEWESALHEPDYSIRRKKLEALLDRGHGKCWLGQPRIAMMTEQGLVDADGRDYRLQAWMVMPNHVHLVVDAWHVPLSRLIDLWKGRSARRANLTLGRRGAFWQADYFDTLVRDETHLRRAIRYTEQNPVKGFLAKDARAWTSSSARLRDKFERLPWQRGRS